MMILRPFYKLAILSISIILFSSCLGTNKNEEDLINRDVQVHYFSIDWKEGKTERKLFLDINQVNPLIYNRDSLPVGTKITKCVADIGITNGTKIKLTFKNPSEVKDWEKKDSIDINRLYKIEVTSEIANTHKSYDFDFRIHNQDPDSLMWTKLTNSYPMEKSSERKSVIVGNNVISYYRTTDGNLKAISSKLNDGKTWSNESLSGLPLTALLSSIVNSIKAQETGVYTVSKEGKLFNSQDGIKWKELPTSKHLSSIVGDILYKNEQNFVVIITEDAQRKMCVTTDFKEFKAITDTPENFPIDNFSSISFSNKGNDYQKFLVLSSWKSAELTWLIKEDVKEGIDRLAITTKKHTETYNNPILFHYNNTLYMICVDAEKKTKLFSSKNYGWDWKKPIDKHNLPKDFTTSKNQGVVVDKSGRSIWILGGENISTNEPAGDVWRGRINRK